MSKLHSTVTRVDDLDDFCDAAFEPLEPTPPQDHLARVAFRVEDGQVMPVREQACAALDLYQRLGERPVCENGTSECEFFCGRKGNHVLCSQHAVTTRRPAVALVALQRREKQPPPHTLN